MQPVYPRDMPKERIPRDVNVESGQEYVVKASTTTPSADALGRLLVYLSAYLNVVVIC